MTVIWLTHTAMAGMVGEFPNQLGGDEETWKELLEMLESVDTCILGRVMYPGYEQFWMAVLANPAGDYCNSWSFETCLLGHRVCVDLQHLGRG
jgi:hypothetical protein